MRHEYAFVFLVGIAVLLGALYFGRRRIEQTRKRLIRLRGMRSQECDTIRQLAAQTLHMARELRRVSAHKDGLEGACESLQQQIRQREAVDRRLYVLDERRTNADQTWIAVIGHSDYGRLIAPKASQRLIKSWRNGRKYVVWAVDEAKAINKVATKLPESHGYQLLSLTLKGAVPELSPPAAKAPQPESGDG